MKTVLFPLNAGLNVSDTLSVSVVPTTVALDVDPFRVHWLFWSVAPVPGVIGPSKAVAPSFIR